MTGVPTVKLGSTLRFTNFEGIGDLPHGHVVPIPVHGPDRRRLPAAGRPDERRAPGRLRLSELGFGTPEIGPAKQPRLAAAVTQEEGFKPGEIVTYFCRVHPFMRGAFEVTK